MKVASGSRDWLEPVRALLQRSLVRNAGWLMVGQGLGLVLQAVYFIVLARVLGSTEYGVFVGAFAFTSIVAIYSPLGTGGIFIRYVSGRPNEFAPYFGNMLLVTSSVGAFLIVGLTLSASRLINAESARLVFLAAIANCLFGQLSVEIARVFQTFEKMRVTALLNLLVSALRTLAALAMLLAMHRASAYQWAVVSTIVSGIAAIAAVFLAIRQFGRPSFKFTLARKHGMEGLGFAFASSTTSVYNDIDKAMLSHYNMNQGNGVYSMAYRLVDIATIPIFAVRDAALPRLFQKGREGIAKSAEYGDRLVVKSILMGAAGSLLLFVCAPAIPMVIGRGFAESVSALRWLAIIPLFRSIHQISGIVLTSAGRQGVRTAAQFTAAAFNFGLNLWLIPRHGWLGAAWASIAADGALAIMNWTILRVILHRSEVPA